MKRTESTLTGDDGTPIFLRHWSPDDASAGGDAGDGGVVPRGAIQVAHGLAEHSGRYEDFAEAMVAAGFLVYASDHRGHGRTVLDDRDLGFFAPPEEDGWDRVLADLAVVQAHVARSHPELPRLLVGHSMGSFLALDLVARLAPDTFVGLVLSGCKRGGGPMVQAGRLAARAERARLGPRGRSGVLNFLSFGSFNHPFRPTRTEFDWLSRDHQQNDAYVSDPRCGFVATTQLWVHFLDALARLGRSETFASVPRELPILMIAGGDDPVANQPPTFEALAQALTGAGVRQLRSRRYPGARHELFHETNRDEVFRDLLGWIDERLGAPS